MMHIETNRSMAARKDGAAGSFIHGVVRHAGDWDVAPVAEEARERGLTALAFDDPAVFRDHAKAVAMCEAMRVLEMNVLWSARLDTVPTGGLLKDMRLAGCQQVDMALDSDEAVEGLFWARRYGFDVRLRNRDGASYVAERIGYTVAEREEIASRLPGLHAAQFDLAAAYFKARRYEEVMLPLGKAMTLGFPLNELCLNLLACLSAAKHYPEQAAGLLDQAAYGCPHPVVFRNRELLRSWLESGGDLKGVRLDLEPASTIFT